MAVLGSVAWQRSMIPRTTTTSAKVIVASPDSQTVIVVSGMRSMVLMQTDHVTPEMRVLVCYGLFVVRDRLDLVR
jgi:hypothetical protein